MAAIEELKFVVIRSLLLSKFELLQQRRDPISRKPARQNGQSQNSHRVFLYASTEYSYTAGSMN
jgi:hypothetical protein